MAILRCLGPYACQLIQRRFLVWDLPLRECSFEKVAAVFLRMCAPVARKHRQLNNVFCSSSGAQSYDRNLQKCLPNWVSGKLLFSIN